jgi:hypothetical protein
LPNEPLGAHAEAAAKGVRAHEVREGELAVDLDDGELLPVAGLEVRPSADVDELELEAELFIERADDLQRPRTEAAVSCVVDRDSRYG